MSQPQYPQQPGWNGPQQPGQPQPGWGGPQQPWGPPPKKRGIGKMIGFGCLGFIAVIVLFGIIGALGSSGGSNTSSNAKPAAPASKDEKPAENTKPSTPAKKTAVFKVWGTAPAGALGPIDITYGSDSDNRQGHWKNGGFTATLPLKKDAMYYQVTAQLQGSGDIHCSVTIGGKTKTGHASGGYNICDAQLNSGLFGGWDG